MNEQSKLKVALVVPTKKGRFTYGTCVPFGIAYIASYLKKEVPSCEVIIIDATIGHNVDETLFTFQPDIVGVTATTPQILDAYNLGDMLRLNRPDILTVVGGVHAEREKLFLLELLRTLWMENNAAELYMVKT